MNRQKSVSATSSGADTLPPWFDSMTTLAVHISYHSEKIRTTGFLLYHSLYAYRSVSSFFLAFSIETKFRQTSDITPANGSPSNSALIHSISSRWRSGKTGQTFTGFKSGLVGCWGGFFAASNVASTAAISLLQCDRKSTRPHYESNISYKLYDQPLQIHFRNCNCRLFSTHSHP